uniref:Uncharacterized protein n=1 Tax=Octopus bimaculoides TaxID=37653 RepID=A0A0L8GWQ0_OCTBM
MRDEVGPTCIQLLLLPCLSLYFYYLSWNLCIRYCIKSVYNPYTLTSHFMYSIIPSPLSLAMGIHHSLLPSLTSTAIHQAISPAVMLLSK